MGCEKICKVVLILLMFSPNMALSHSLLFTPTDTELTDKSQAFVEYAYATALKYRAKNSRMPATWDELWPMLEKNLANHSLLSDSLHVRKGAALIVLDVKRKKEYRRYIISDGAVWKVASVTPDSADDWMIRSHIEGAIRSFPSEQKEIQRIGEIREKLHDTSLLGRAKNILAERYFYSWRFYHPDAFALLYDLASDKTRTCSFRIDVVKAMIDTPLPGRFKNYLPKLKTVLNQERAKVNADEAEYQKILIERLQELCGLIERK